MYWITEHNGWVGHPIIGTWPDGTPIVMPWNEAPLTGEHTLSLRRRMVHRCAPWSIGVHGYFARMDVIERCWCGGVRDGYTVGLVHAWAGPESREILNIEYDTPWRDRFSRYWGTAVFYRPTLRPVEGA